MKQNNRKWRGWAKINPEAPDTVLGRFTRWRKGGRYATGAYPEPINIIAAAAYAKIPRQLEEYSLLYLDEKTKLWVQCIDVRGHSVEEGEQWAEKEKTKGALAIWVNSAAQPLRPEEPLFFAEDR